MTCSPLSVIYRFSQLNLLQLDKDAKISQENLWKAMEMIYSSSKDLNTMIAGILDVSKLESGEMLLQPEEFDAVSLLQKESANLSVKAERVGIKLNCEIEIGNLPIKTDKGLLSRVLQNLISNAIKYSPQESTVYLSLEQSDDGDIFFRFGMMVRESFPNTRKKSSISSSK